MRFSRTSLKPSLLLSTFCTLALFTSGSLGQDETTTSGDGTTTTSETDTTTAAAATTTTSSDDATSTTSAAAMPTLSTSTKASDMPTLSSTSNAAGAGTAIPTYPAATVPPTSNAPYMQKSSMPDGTVFIAVGAILGAFGLAILLWRAIIAWQLHRSVEKAAMAQQLANDKATFPVPAFYKYSDHDSAPNVGSGRGVRRSARGPVPSSTPSQTNLFFSPTAAPGANPRESVYRDSPNRDSSYRDSSYRDSRFLPAGFYAAGQASPQNVDGADGSSISLNNLRPESRGHARGLSSHTNPDSPGFGPQRSHLARDVSSSSVNLNAAPDGRAPSAYLDDLLAEHPEMFPPSGTTPTPTNAHHPNHPYRQSGRF